MTETTSEKLQTLLETTGVRVVVTGGRQYGNAEWLGQMLDSIKIIELAQGGASGADALARQWAEARQIPCRQFNADWQRFKKVAGPIRNREMLTNFRPDLVIAFPGGKGTNNCVELARRFGIPVWFTGG
jgi:UDP-N-acetylmuramoylalanine-D-glutamate ligase